jgi:hypothetical protein
MSFLRDRVVTIPVIKKKNYFKKLIPRRWEDNIKIDLQEVGGGCGDCMELA